MKRIMVVLICALVAYAAFAPVRGTVTHASAAPAAVGEPIALERILPDDYAFVGTVTDLDSDGKDIAYIDQFGTHLLTADENGGFAASVVEGTHKSVAMSNGLTATLAENGTVTVHAAEPATQSYVGAIDIALTDNRLVVLDAEKISFIPYAKTETSLSFSPAVTVAHGLRDPLALFYDGAVTAILWQPQEGRRAVEIGVGASESALSFYPVVPYPFLQVLHGIAAIGGTVCYLVDDELRVANEAQTVYPLLTDNTRPLSEGRLTSRPDAICAYGGGVLIADSNNGVGFIQAFDENFGFLRTVACSTDSDARHLALPSAAAAAADKLYVADTDNNRILTVGDETALAVERPVDVCRSAQNVLWVQTPTAIVGYRDGKQETALAFVGTDLLLRGDDTLLAAGVRDGKSGVWAIRGTEATLLFDGTYTRIASSDKRRDVLALSGDTIVRLTDGAEPQTVATVEGAHDLLCDDNGALFALTDDALVAIDADGTATTHALAGDWDRNCTAYALFLCATDRIDGLSCGDVGIVSRDGSALYAARGLAYADDWSTLVWPEDFLAAEEAQIEFFRTTAAATISSAPDPDFTFATIAAGTVVFAAKDATDSEFYRQVVVELPEAATFRYQGKEHISKLVTGFVLGSRLETLEPVSYPYRSVVRMPGVRLQKYPSSLAVTLAEPTVGTTAEMLPMPIYRDPTGTLWYKVGIGDESGERVCGFIREDNLRREYYSDPISSGDPNATVHANNLVGTVTAYAYDEVGHAYLPMMADADTPVTIPDGARVRIVGKFNSRAAYTNIVYTDREFGELNCFVPTDRIERDNLGVIEAVAIGLFVMTVLIGATVFVMRRRNRI